MAKETAKIVIVGHVDHGKSTLIGRLLLDTNSLSKDKLAEIKRISKELGKDTELAFLTDQLKEERERNITIDTTQIFFKTRRKDYVIIDAPGHVEFLKNMITGATQAEAAVLIIDTKEGVKEQSRRHAYIVSMLGIDKVIVVFNKMDLLNYSEDVFTKVKDEMSRFLGNLGVKPIHMIPISAKQGDNIYNKSHNMKWYRGPALLEALDNLRFSEKAERKPLRFPVQDIYDVGGKKIVVGKVSSGFIRTGRDAVLFPSGNRVKIKSIEVFGKHKTEAETDECIGLTFASDIAVKRGDVITSEENMPKPTIAFKGNIFWMAEEPLALGKSVSVRCATQTIECTLNKIEKRINTSTLELLEENATRLLANEAAIITLKSNSPVIVEKFSFIEELGRFVIEKGYNLQGAGIITQESA